MVFWMVSKAYACSLRCFANLDECLLFQNAFLCSLNRIAKLLPVFPTHAFLQWGHVSLYTPDIVYFPVVWFFMFQLIVDGVVSVSFEVSPFECVGNECCFFFNVGECSPFVCWCLCG
jgi:hypothetical protein